MYRIMHMTCKPCQRPILFDMLFGSSAFWPEGYYPQEQLRIWASPGRPRSAAESSRFNPTHAFLGTCQCPKRRGGRRRKAQGMVGLRGRKVSTNFFWDKLFEHPQGSWTSRQNSRDIPGSSLPSPRKTNFRGRARTFRPPPLREEDPTHPTRRSLDLKS